MAIRATSQTMGRRAVGGFATALAFYGQQQVKLDEQLQPEL